MQLWEIWKRTIGGGTCMIQSKVLLKKKKKKNNYENTKTFVKSENVLLIFLSL